MELEKNEVVKKEHITRWKGYLAKIKPESCYDQYAKTLTDSVKNWALFTGCSEYFRQSIGLCDASEFVDLQIAQQLQWFDENGMYMDAMDEFHHPLVYDLVSRGLVALLLFAGYRGKYYKVLDDILRKAGLLTLNMQSATGECAFGGRSNQFVHNEAWLAAIFEYESSRYQREENYTLAKKFKAAALQALKVIEFWLSQNPISHVKNKFSINSKFGCEKYAYFDKYMITTASNLYTASLFCDDAITSLETDFSPMIWSTSKYFHKTFVRAGEYSLEFEMNASAYLDANGLGRIQKKGAPSAICISVPFPFSQEGCHYSTGDYKNECNFSVCPSIKKEDGWIFGAGVSTKYTLGFGEIGSKDAQINFNCSFENGEKLCFLCSVDEDGVLLKAQGNVNEEVGIALPIFAFDGKNHTKINESNNRIIVEYEGWSCEYSAQNISNLQKEFANRNGIYKGYIATGKGKVSVRIKIYPFKAEEGE
ncbi:MAG: hypothetical protein IJ506_07280 [Clostridia bacterium]|nr:hypothetical protein [Clostridia bacterium]